MWTYFILFLSIAALIAVFTKRSILLHLKKKALIEDALKPVEKKDEEDLKEVDSIEKTSKTNKLKIANLLTEADSFLKKGNEEEAVKTLIQALTIEENHLETLQKLAMLYLQKQMLGAAAALFKQLAELTKDPVHYSHLGLALYQQSSLEEAKDAYQKSVELDPSRAQRFVSLAQVYRSLSQPQNAVIALSKAIELDGENLEVLLLLAAIYIDLEKIEDAETSLKNILEKDPEHQDALDLLKQISKKPETTK